MFRTQGLKLRKIAVTSTGTVQCMSTCMVHTGTSEYVYAKITIGGLRRYMSIKYLNFKHADINIKYRNKTL